MNDEQRATLFEELAEVRYQASPTTHADGIRDDGSWINERELKWSEMSDTQKNYYRGKAIGDPWFPIIERILAERAAPGASDPDLKHRLQRVIREAYMAGVADCGRSDEDSDAYVYHNIDDDLNYLFPGGVPGIRASEQETQP